MKNMLYEVNNQTIALIPIDKNNTKIIEEERELIIEENTFQIIKNSCMYFGSSYEGRHKATKSLIGVSHKSPIIIEESRMLIFFPTTSPRLENCIWFNFKKLVAYFAKEHKTFLTMNNGHNIELDISYGTIDNQILRSSYLESTLRQRKEKVKV